PGGERARDLHQAQLHGGERRGEPRFAAGEAHPRDRLPRTRVGGGVSVLRRKRADDDVVEQGKARESPHDLEGAPDSCSADCERRLADELAAVELDAAGTGDDEAVERVEERRLAGAVGSDDAEDLALADLERNLLQRAE